MTGEARALARPHPGRLALLTLVLVVLLAHPALALNSGESRLVSLTNSARSSYGLRSLVVAGDLAARAHQHSIDMASRGFAFHSSSLPPSSGENIGKVHSVDEAHRLFMQSPSHQENILGPYTVIGTGVVQRGEWLYVTELFSVRRVSGRVWSPRRASRRAVTPRRVVRALPVVEPPQTLAMLRRILFLDSGEL